MKAVKITAEDKALMETLLSAGHIEHKFAVRLQTVLLRSQGERNNTIVRFLGISVSAVTSYINRYLNNGIESLLHDKTRKPGKKKISQEIRGETCQLVCTEKPAGQTHWSCRSLAKKVGIGHTSVNVILRELGLQPHRVSKRTYSNDPEFEKKLKDVVGTIHEPS